MFIINQNKNIIVELKSVKLYSCYSENIQNELSEIYKRIKIKEYNYGTSEKCNNAIKEEQERYLSNKPKEYKISINGVEFAVYNSEINAQIQFYNIQSAITLNHNLYTMEEDYEC